MAVAKTINITSSVTSLNITKSGLDITWTTDIAGTSEILYGKTPALELGHLYVSGITTDHLVSIASNNPSQIFYVKAISVSGTDTAFSKTEIFITESNSSGIIKIYFNKTVNNSIANPSTNLAISLNQKIGDTLAAYINRATQSIDIAIYNIDNSTTLLPVIQAINNAYNRGIQIRIIAEGGNTNYGLSAINSSIPVLLSPTSINYGIMHNKFMIIDANASDPDLPIVWTGSTNWSNAQITTDANNVIIIQDQSLAIAYTMEFNEMWGDTGMIPNQINSRFGPYKTNNTPHEFIIGGHRVESYFSPSDTTSAQIIKTISTSDRNLFFSLLVWTRTEMAYAMANRITNYGIYSAGLVEDTANGGGPPYQIVAPLMSNRFLIYNQPGILHHKYMIVDEGDSAFDPLVLTGSHNWSNAANTKNDENTLIVHDPLIANQYYQEFHKCFTDNGGVFSDVSLEGGQLNEYMIFPNPSSQNVNLKYQSKNIISEVVISVLTIDGRLMRVEKAKQRRNQEFNIDIINLPSGLYIVEVNDGNTSSRQKLIISR